MKVRLEPLLTREERDTVLDRLRNLAGSRELFRFVRLHVTTRHVCEELDKHIAGSRLRSGSASCGHPAHIRARQADRHSARRPRPHVGTVSRYLCRVMRSMMEKEFAARVEPLAG